MTRPPRLTVAPHWTGRVAVVPLDPAAVEDLRATLARFPDRWWHPQENLWTLPAGASVTRLLAVLCPGPPPASR